jgi:predicted acylesterase/phospholipase RssA
MQSVKPYLFRWPPLTFALRFVCAVKKSINEAALFRSYDQPKAVDSPWAKCTIWEAARATSAASTIFDPIQISGQSFLDGATENNNPVHMVWDEARLIWGEDLETRLDCIISIGTGRPDLSKFGDSIKEVVKTLARIATDTEKKAESFYTRFEELGLGDRYFRFNVERGLRGIGLHEHSQSELIEAATESYLGKDGCSSKIAALVSLDPPPASM